MPCRYEYRTILLIPINPRPVFKQVPLLFMGKCGIESMQIALSRIRQPMIMLGSALLLFFALHIVLHHSPARTLYAQATNSAGNGCTVPGATGAGATCHAALVTPTLLAIYALAFDNETGSPTSLSAYYTATVQSIISATAAAPDRVAVLLIDRDGFGDTQIIIAQNGVAIPVEGLPRAEHLSLPVMLDATVIEYDMADGWYLGNFIRWARGLYPAASTLFSFVGHGAPLTPQLRALTEGVPSAAPTLTPTPVGTPVPQTDINPLPPRWGAHSAFTDYHAASLISVRSLAQALSIGTENGANPLTVVDLLHCFSATIEELYEIHPYAQTIIAAPNYTYAEPAMLGETLATLDVTQPPAALAQALVAGYDSRLPSDEHPRLFIAVDADKLAPIKVAWDQTADELLAEWAIDAGAARTHLLAAYQASAKYDTTICQPQDWEIAPPDALSDMADFAGQLQAQFGAQSAVGAWAMTTTQTISAAIIARHRHDGVPWFADREPAPQWTFPAAGIALFTDFAPKFEADQPQFSWQAPWYTYTVSSGNPYPYAFIRPGGGGDATWADLFDKLWTVPVTATTGCLPGFASGRGAGELWVTALTPITNRIDGAFYFSATVASAQPATNPLLRFRVYRADDNTIGTLFEQILGSSYLGAAGRRTLKSTTAWQPTRSGHYTVEAIIDVDNRFQEENEIDNIITATLSISVPSRVYLPTVAR